MYLPRYTLKLAPSALAALPPNALPVPITAQTSDYSCGTAAVTAILRYFQVYDGSEKPLRRQMGTTKEGTGPREMVDFLSRTGLDASYEEGCSLARLLYGLTPTSVPMIAFQAWGGDDDLTKTVENGHYAVLIGFDGTFCYFMDPLLGGRSYGFLPHFELAERWRDVGLKNDKAVARQVIWTRGSRPRREAIKSVHLARIK